MARTHYQPVRIPPVSPNEQAVTCPRCATELTSFTLRGSNAVVCDACGYVDIPTDHHADGTTEETWEEALHRFEAEYEAPLPTETAAPIELHMNSATYLVTPAVSEQFNSLTPKQQAIIDELLAETDPMNPDRSRKDLAESADVHPSYVSDVVKEYGEIAAALAASPTIDTNDDDTTLTGE